MSLEPQTTAKVRFHTTKGTIDIELWAKETPITSRNFLTNVLNKKYDDCIFNRILPNFIVQIEGQFDQELFQDEFHPRIRFNKRGIIGSVNLDKRNTNTGKFFITLKETPELNSKNTPFGKVVGDSIFTVLKISEGQLDESSGLPLYPVKIIRAEVLIPFFDDLKAEGVEKKKVTTNEKKTSFKKPKVKLNFGDDEEEDEEELDLKPVLKIKMKSAHESLNDKRLSKNSAIIEKTDGNLKANLQDEADNFVIENENKRSQDSEEISQEREAKLEEVKNQIKLHQEDLSTDDNVQESDGKHSTGKKSSAPLSKEFRELETQKLLKSFQEKIQNKKNHTSNPLKEKKDVKINSGHDDDFDNLDDSDSDSDSDLYTHKLKFDDNESNDKLANEDLLVTIDNGVHNEQLKKRRNDHIYKNLQSSTIISKRSKR